MKIKKTQNQLKDFFQKIWRLMKIEMKQMILNNGKIKLNGKIKNLKQIDMYLIFNNLKQ